MGKDMTNHKGQTDGICRHAASLCLRTYTAGPSAAMTKAFNQLDLKLCGHVVSNPATLRSW